MKSTRWLLLAALCVACPTQAHEYWLEPPREAVAPGDSLRITVRNGEDFVGSSLPFDPRRFAEAALVSPQGRRAIGGRLGDYPALRAPVDEAGVHRVLLQTLPRSVSYDGLADFERFLDYHGLDGIAALHAERKLPPTDIVENYTRHCVTVVDVRAPGQAGSGADRHAAEPLGLTHELVLLDDPFAKSAKTVRLRVLFDGQPLDDVQVEMFVRNTAGTVRRDTVRSDAQGQVSFDVSASGDYLFNSVHVTPPDAAAIDEGTHWRSFWASLTWRRGPAAAR